MVDRYRYRIRPAEKSDCRSIAELTHISSDGVSNYIWSQFADQGEDLLDIGQHRYERENADFSYQNCSIVEIDNKVAGMLIAFPMYTGEEEKGSGCDPVLAPYSRLEEDDSYYVSGVALFPKYRGQGIGTHLLVFAENKALENGRKKLSLIVFDQNEGAKRLYQRHGYQITAREAIVPHKLIKYTGDALLMVKYLA